MVTYRIRYVRMSACTHTPISTTSPSSSPAAVMTSYRGPARRSPTCSTAELAGRRKVSAAPDTYCTDHGHRVVHSEKKSTQFPQHYSLTSKTSTSSLTITVTFRSAAPILSLTAPSSSSAASASSTSCVPTSTMLVTLLGSRTRDTATVVHGTAVRGSRTRRVVGNTNKHGCKHQP